MSENTNETPTTSNAPAPIAYHVKDVEGGREKGFWTRIGAAFPHKDGKGFNLVLDLLPPDGKVVLRENEPKEA